MQTSRGRARDGGELQGLLARPFFPQTPRKWTRLLQVHDLHRNRVTSTRRTCDLRRGGAAAKSLAAAQKPDDGTGQEPARKGEGQTMGPICPL